MTYTLNAVGTRTGRHDAAFAPETFVHDAIDQLTGTAYHHRDGQMSTIALSDANGDIIESVRHDAFGLPEFTDADGLPLAESPTGNRFLFTGREWLADVQLYDYRHRAYSPELGRFLQTDPIRFAAGDGNLYRYVTNAPGDWMDPFGLCHTDLGDILSDPEFWKQPGTVVAVGGAALAFAAIPFTGGTSLAGAAVLMGSAGFAGASFGLAVSDYGRRKNEE